MTTVGLIVIGVVVVFLVAFFSPRLGSHWQRLSRKGKRKSENTASDKPTVLRWLIAFPAKLSNLAVVKSIKGGKKTRHKAPF